MEGLVEGDEAGHTDEEEEISDDEETVSGEDSEDEKNRHFRNSQRASFREHREIQRSEW